MKKYDRLTEYLCQQSDDRRRLSFTEIETIIGSALPPSARNYHAWWGNDSNPDRQSYAWLSAGWKTEDINITGETVTFRRGHVPRRATPLAREARKAPSGRTTLDTLIEAPDGTIEIGISMNWKYLGPVALETDDIAFPGAPAVPGLYRIRLLGSDSRHYIGETVNLQRRFYHYRRPGPSQQTNVRINEALRAHLAAGESVEVDVLVSDIELQVSQKPLVTNLADKATRRLLEYAAIVTGGSADISSLNR